MNKRIALLDDDPKVLSIYTELLERNEFSSLGFQTTEELDKNLETNHVDGFVLDVSLPGESDAGLHYCSDLRSRFPLSPIVILSGLKSTVDIVSGYRMGADNYLLKGSNSAPSALIAVLQASFRRINQIEAASDARDEYSSISATAPIRVDKNSRSVNWAGSPVNLSPRDFLVFYALYKHEGRVISKERLKSLSGLEMAPETMAGIVRSIRSAFMEADPEFSAIQTERNLGYRWFYAA